MQHVMTIGIGIGKQDNTKAKLIMLIKMITETHKGVKKMHNKDK